MVIGNFLRQARVKFLPCTIIPLALGGAVAYLETGRFDWVTFTLCLVGASAAHFGVNLANDYFDFRQGADRIPETVRSFSGGGGAITRDGVSPQQVRNWFWACFFCGLVCGILIHLLIDKGDLLIHIIAVLGFLGGYFYTSPPFRLAYRGLGELDIFVFLGPMPALGAYVVQTGTLSWRVVLLSLPVAGLITALLLINEFTDYASDKSAGKQNLVVRLGPGGARWLLLALVVFIFAMILVPVLGGWIAPLFLAAMLPLPLAALAVARVVRWFHRPEALARAQLEFVLVHMLVGILCVGAVVASA